MKFILTIVGFCFAFAFAFAGKNPECDEAKKVGPCKAHVEKYFYNSDNNSCETFVFGGCQPNGNNFDTQEQCEEKCKIPACEEPKKVGPCRAIIEKYYYDTETNECQTFNYGGCQANGNNFETKAECEENCLKEQANSMSTSETNTDA